MGMQAFCSWTRMTGRWLRCIGKIPGAHRGEVQQDLSHPHAQGNAACVQTYFLFQHDEVRHEPQDTAIHHGHSDISVTLNVYTHVQFDDAQAELLRVAQA